ncbi:MAG: hypothetical protein FWH54_07045 [Methanobrevibacter sp.]|nr:hypothetical protein [Methanobrevibacter sp.]
MKENYPNTVTEYKIEVDSSKQLNLEIPHLDYPDRNYIEFILHYIGINMDIVTTGHNYYLFLMELLKALNSRILIIIAII